MPDPEVNIPLLRKAVEWAETEAAKPAVDSEWVQHRWISDPLMAAISSLDDTPYEDLRWDELKQVAEQIAPHCGTAYCIAGYIGQSLDVRYATTAEVDGVHVSGFAAEALGISDTSPLFHANNTIEDVRRIAEDIAGERL